MFPFHHLFKPGRTRLSTAICGRVIVYSFTILKLVIKFDSVSALVSAGENYLC